MLYDVLIAGGGPAGLSAALTLGRACKRVLLCDAGPRRNAAAVHVHNFVTRDGTPPDDFRRVAREQLAAYPAVEVRDAPVRQVTGARGAFRAEVGAEVVEARRVLLCTGVVDDLPPVEGLATLWGHAVFQCPYCHGWELKGRRWGYLAAAHNADHALAFVLQLRAWTPAVTLFTGGELPLDRDAEARLRAAGVSVEGGAVIRLIPAGSRLEAVELEDGRQVPCEVLFAHPRQRQVSLVQSLAVATDEHGYVVADAMRKETSVPGVYAAGDLTSRMQAAVAAAAAGMQARAMLNLDLTLASGTATSTA